MCLKILFLNDVIRSVLYAPKSWLPRCSSATHPTTPAKLFLDMSLGSLTPVLIRVQHSLVIALAAFFFLNLVINLWIEAGIFEQKTYCSYKIEKQETYGQAISFSLMKSGRFIHFHKKVLSSFKVVSANLHYQSSPSSLNIYALKLPSVAVQFAP